MWWTEHAEVSTRMKKSGDLRDGKARRKQWFLDAVNMVVVGVFDKLGPNARENIQRSCSRLRENLLSESEVKMGRLVGGHREATGGLKWPLVTIRSLQNSISARSGRWSLSSDRHGWSRGPHEVSLTSVNFFFSFFFSSKKLHLLN